MIIKAPVQNVVCKGDCRAPWRKAQKPCKQCRLKLAHMSIQLNTPALASAVTALDIDTFKAAIAAAVREVVARQILGTGIPMEVEIA